MVEQRLVLTLLDGGDQVPDEALDLLIALVVPQAVNQQSPATLATQSAATTMNTSANTAKPWQIFSVVNCIYVS